jgi:magnesium-transporting ATPase (P-type)
VTFGEKANILAQELRTKIPRIGVIPFESEHKFMCTFHEHPEDKTKVVMYAKGAPDRLVVRSATQLNGATGMIEPISVEFWQQQAMELSSKGLRCLAICTATLDSTAFPDAVAKGSAFLTSAPEPFLCFLGLAAIMDPPRQECVVAIKEAHEAGVEVKMITGDHPATAKSIGQQLGIVDAEHDMVLTGPELDTMSMEQLRGVVLKCNVYARASPENKISIVRALQAEGIVCSMTGDGVNDAPALRAANIGVAMGITGTDVSKDAAKMILTDDNFATILVAVKEGRRVWDNLKKLLIFNMPASFAQGGVVFFALCLQWSNVPLTAIQILYVSFYCYYQSLEGVHWCEIIFIVPGPK